MAYSSTEIKRRNAVRRAKIEAKMPKDKAICPCRTLKIAGLLAFAAPTIMMIVGCAAFVISMVR